MLHKQNLHTHTTYSDGKDSVEDMVLEAVKRGFSGIGFSEHSYNRYSRSRQMTVEAMGRYVAQVREMKEKYRGIIDVFCGLEYELFSEISTEGMDYLIGSVHYLECPAGILGFDTGLEAVQTYIREQFRGDGMAFAKQYYKTVMRLPEKGQFDILGHFDLVTKNNEKGGFLDTRAKEYLDAGYEAIHALKGKIPLFEVNTGAVARGYRSEAYPQMEFLKEFKACGFGAVITSDCHNKQYLDCGFEDARQMLRQAGFSSQWILTDGGFREVEL